ncbi:hypothetical protein CVP04_04790, partial [Caviibacterium pharyngocola]
MNKIFRVIWNETLQIWIAVSELSKGRVKSSSYSTLLSDSDDNNKEQPTHISSYSLSPNTKTAATAVLGAFTILTAFNADAIQGTRTTITASSTQGTSIAGGIATGDTNAIAIGSGGGKGNNAVNPATASAPGAIAIGASSIATKNLAVAIGWDTKATGVDSVAYGSQANATANGTSALGTRAEASIENSVAIGIESVTTAANTGNDAKKLTYTNSTGAQTITYVGTGSSAVVSIGNSTITRQLQYVSAGLISAASTDAINGSQLYAVATVAKEALSTAIVAASDAKTAVSTANSAASTATAAASTVTANLAKIETAASSAIAAASSAASSATSASNSASSAASSATAASNSATSAASSATAASSSATAASNSATSAASSATAASSSATAASNSATSAASSATAASSSATAASNSATSAASSATAA